MRVTEGPMRFKERVREDKKENGRQFGLPPPIPRHCEERQRRSNPVYFSDSGLLRFARNDN
jgi:hypothetical protein